jgi:hypothetical protein
MSRTRWRREYLITVSLASLLACSSANSANDGVDAAPMESIDAPIAPPTCTTPAEKREKTEISCDDLDNDCDGTVDNVVNPPPWYPDKDGDKFGDSSAPRFQCKKPDGYTDAGGDCDDNEATAHPTAAEVCDGVDNDCKAETAETCGACKIDKYNGHVYLYCNEKKTWTDAKGLCEGQGFRLTKIEDKAENDHIRAAATANGDSENWLIGATDSKAQGNWLWLDDKQFWQGVANGHIVDGNYANWTSNEPNNDGTEDCGEITKTGTWNDNKCGNARPYVCERY